MNRYFPSACEANNWKEVQTFIVSPVNVGNLERQQLSNYGVDYRCYVDAVVRVLALYSVYTLISTLQNLFNKRDFSKYVLFVLRCLVLYAKGRVCYLHCE